MILERQIRHVILPLREYGGSFSLPLSVQVLRLLSIRPRAKLYGTIMIPPGSDLGARSYIFIDRLNEKGGGCDIRLTIAPRIGRNDATMTIPRSAIKILGWEKGDDISWTTDGKIMEIDKAEVCPGPTLIVRRAVNGRDTGKV